MKDDSFKDFVLDQLQEIEQRRGATDVRRPRALSRRNLFGIVHKGRLYFKTDEHTVAAYRGRKMKPFRPIPKQTLRSYYQVPVEIIEDGDRLGAWAEAAIRCQRKKD